MSAFKSIVTPSGGQLYDHYHFSEAALCNQLLLCSGVIGTTPDGGVPENPEQEYRNAWQAISSLLAEAGMGPENIVEYTSYHVNLQDQMATFMSVRDEFLSEPWPAWTAIGITELAVPGARVEIRITARKE